MKRMYSVMMASVILSASVSAATYGGGSGTEADPYQIWTAEQMNSVGLNQADWGSCFKLMADIDMSAYIGTQYNLIGNNSTSFTGTFDGDGHTIRNLTYVITTGVYCAGVFGYTSNATIENLGIENIDIYAKSIFTGGLVGCQSGGTITHCCSTGSVSSSSTSHLSTGGLVGYQLTGGTITHCYSTCSVVSYSASSAIGSYVGGLVGWQNNGTITHCCSTGSVVASSSLASAVYAGGLVGQQDGTGTVTHCCSTGSVASSAPSALAYAGGLVGRQVGAITNCCSTGSVASSVSAYSAYTGGLVGYSSSGIQKSYSTGLVFAGGNTVYKGGLAGYKSSTFTACFWDTQRSGMTAGVGTGTSTGATGKTTAEMRTLSTFTGAGWDFTTDWQMPAAGYPYLAWIGCAEYPVGDLDQNCKVDMADLMILSTHWLEGV